MSSSYRNPPRNIAALVFQGPIRLAAVLTCAFAAQAQAAQVYTQPILTVGAQGDTNLGLDVMNKYTVGYYAEAASIIGIASAASDTNLEPRLRYTEFPTERALDRFEGSLNFNSSYSTPRSYFYIYGLFDHLNDTEEEFPSGVYDPINPIAPTSVNAGPTSIGVTQNNLWVAPKYTYDLTQLVGVGVSGVAQRVTYSPADPFGHVDFDYYQGQLMLSRKFGPRTQLSLAGYGARYSAIDLDSTANAGGANLELDYKWSARASGGVSVSYQHTNIDQVEPSPFRSTANTWGASFDNTWKQQTGQWRITIERDVSPNAGGGLFATDQAQTEYDHDLTQLLSVTGALKYVATRGLSANVSRFDITYYRADLSLKRMLARTWFVQGGYGFLREKYLSNAIRGSNNELYVRFGYQGLPRQQ